MDVGQWLQWIPAEGLPAAPWLVAVLVAVAILLIWLAFAPSRPKVEVQERVNGYLDRSAVVDQDDVRKPFASRALAPMVRGILRALGRLAPKGSVERMQERLVQAGQPGGLTALDFYGLRLLCMVLLGAGYFFLFGRNLPGIIALRNTLVLVTLGFILPTFWLNSRVRQRKNKILRALPDALDMLTIGVEAGLAFESAMLRVGDQWENALTREFRRAVMEMRVGTSRDEALQRMADRTGVPDLNTFVAVLVQSSKLGVSIAHVLHSQAAQMRVRRRQRAEELARQAGIKMIFPLAFCVFPAILVVILGPSIPAFLSFFESMGGGVSGGFR